MQIKPFQKRHRPMDTEMDFSFSIISSAMVVKTPFMTVHTHIGDVKAVVVMTWQDSCAEEMVKYHHLLSLIKYNTIL